MAAPRSNNDPFAAVRAGTLAHLRRHGCGCYPFFDGSLLGVIAGAARAQRILELGTALGYTACWFAHGAPEARIDTIDFDPEHVRLARGNIEAAGFADRVVLHEGAFDKILPTLEPGYRVLDPVPGSAGRAFRRTPGRWSGSPRMPATTSIC